MRKSSNEAVITMPIWGAVSPTGKVLKSSVCTFRAVAARWAQKSPGHQVQKLGDLTYVADISNDDAIEVPEKHTAAEVAAVLRNGPGRPRKTHPAVEAADRSNVTDLDSRRGRGRPKKNAH